MMTHAPRQQALENSAFDVVRSVADWLQQHQVGETRVLLGVSGGADSVALLRAVDEVRSFLGLEVVIAHLDHGLRDGSSTEAEWVSDLGGHLGLPVVLERVDVARKSAESGQGVEETARKARYDFFQRVAVKSGCPYIAVAHTANDQAETILHHIVRGTGLSGLQGIPASRSLSTGVTLIRPLLGTSRESIVAFLQELGQEYLTDQSNIDERFTRNRVRHRLLPLLRDQFNPQVEQALLRLSQQATDAQTLLEEIARAELQAVLLNSSPQRLALNADRMADLSPHLLREVLRQAWLLQDWPRQRMGFDVWQRLVSLVQSPESVKSISLPHQIQATCDGSNLVIERSAGDSVSEQVVGPMPHPK
ncbi:MAG: tRNA lysidine(34) synthetase TilS [Planctomycetaceae bacterium]|nr:tRNA lysidine(34) synthetase TilS [Planctomycetaceae bacterium]